MSDSLQPMDCSTPGFSVLHNLQKFAKISIDSMMLSNHLILCCPLFIKPSISPSIKVFSSESTLCIRWPNYLSFSFSITPFNEYLGLNIRHLKYLILGKRLMSKKTKIMASGPICYSVIRSCPTLCQPTDCSMPGFPDFHHLQELTQIHVHWVSNALQTPG